MASLVSNSGQINAPGGTVLLTADAVAGVLDHVVGSSGTINAPTYAQTPGSVTLDAGPGNTAQLSGTINVAGLSPGQTGGNAVVTGGSVALTSTARIDARGYSGGGTVKIGGGPHGADPKVNNAQYTTVATDALIDASATGKGNGGTVSVWADGSTVFAGDDPRERRPAGRQWWLGGDVRSWRARRVEPTAFVSTLALDRSMTGTWLLDPGDINVTTGTTTATSDNQSPRDSIRLWPTPSTASVINNGDLVNALNNNNVTHQHDLQQVLHRNAGETSPFRRRYRRRGQRQAVWICRRTITSSHQSPPSRPSGDAAQVYLFAGAAISINSSITASGVGSFLNLQAGLTPGSAASITIACSGYQGANRFFASGEQRFSHHQSSDVNGTPVTTTGGGRATRARLCCSNPPRLSITELAISRTAVRSSGSTVSMAPSR